MKKINTEYKLVHFADRKAWRSWLAVNHQKENGIWMVYYKKHTGKATISYDDAVEEALCFGWIDSTVRRIDDEKYSQRFTPRKNKSIWSELNKSRVEKMIKERKMTKYGLAKIFVAKTNGYWDTLSQINNTDIVPTDFEKALSCNSKADRYFNELSPSNKKQFLWWIVSAKTTVTRSKRIEEAVRRLSQGKKYGTQ